MNIVVPLNGEGTRFSATGAYSDPKPLIRVHGREILFWLLDSVFECLSVHDSVQIIIAYNASLNAHDFADRVRGRYRGKYPSGHVKLVPLHFETCGAVETIALALQLADKLVLTNPTVCLDGDVWYPARVLKTLLHTSRSMATMTKNLVAVQRVVQNKTSSYSPFSHVVIDSFEENNRVTNIVEKVAVSEFACTGMYVFHSSERLMQLCMELLFPPKQNMTTATHNMQFGELYTSSLIKHDLHNHAAHYEAVLVDVDNGDVVCFGTPEHVQTYLRSSMMSLQQGEGESSSKNKDDHQVAPKTKPPTVKTRRFHQVTIDEATGTVLKQALTDDAARGLANQVRYYQLVGSYVTGSTLTFPTIIDAAGGWYQMQYIPGENLAVAFVNQRMTVDDLRCVLTSLKHLHQLDSHTDSSKRSESREKENYDNYVPKLLHRMRLLNDDDEDDDDLKEAERINTLIKRCIDYFEHEYSANDMAKHGRCIHGDPVLSNIISVDRDKIAFIDVRAGHFSALDGCERFAMGGDALYDYAKLYQSLSGYEEILEGTQVPMKYRAEMMAVLCEHVADVLSAEHVVAMKHAAALLLLSLLPLHARELRPAFVSLVQHLLVL